MGGYSSMTGREWRNRLPGRLASLVITASLLVALVVTTSAAQAVMLDVNGSRYGVALVPGTSTTGLPTVTSSAPCSDPWLSPDLAGPSLPPTALCWQGGGTTPSDAVMHANETFAITWDPIRADWATTRDFIEQFMRDVADASNTFTSPYALTTQYNDYGGRAQNVSKYGGGCIDYGNPGGSACQFGNTIGTGLGNNYPASACPVASLSNCLTDTQVKSELTTMVNNMGLVGRLQPGYTPLLVLLTPPGVQVCLDSTSPLCSYYKGSSVSGAQFCSYHSYVTVGNKPFAYVVQPWTTFSSFPWMYGRCDEPNLPPVPPAVSAQQLAQYAGMALVNPVSQGEIAAIVNPWLNGWFGNNGAEVSDNGCGPGGDPYDAVVVGSSKQNPYFLQPEFNNAGAIEIDPNALQCELGVTLAPTFVVPSPINRGDVVAFDGSVTVSTLMVPSANYQWDFGDGTKSIGPSVVHAYTYGGAYTVTLSVTDRGGNASTISQSVDVLGPGGPAPAPPPGPSPGLALRAQLMPQGLRSVLRSGIVMRVTSNVQGDGIVTLTIPRAAARRAHIKAGPGPTVMVGRGTVSGITAGTVVLHLRLLRATAVKLRRLGHVTVTVHLLLFASGGRHIALDIAGRY
jgi:hypothetical protein